jgi:hypothetical protein
MKTFLKVLLLLVAALVCIKLLPFALGLACASLAVLGGLALLGASLAALFVTVALLAALVLSPIWVPVLLICGLVALCRRGGSAQVS